jgi:hypothetical protein
MSYLGPLFTPTFAAILLIAYPVLTLVLMRRAGIRGPKLLMALLPAVCMFLGGYAFYWFMDSGISQALSWDATMQIVIAKNLGVFIGAISPLLILAILKWPALDKSTSPETFS